MTKESSDAVISLAVQSLVLGDVQLLGDQVLVGLLVGLVEDRRNRAQAELLEHLGHEVELHS